MEFRRGGVHSFVIRFIILQKFQKLTRKIW